MSAIGKLSKEEYQKQKDLDAARKAGTAPPEVDEEGNEINPHIPQYIVKAPWYLDTGTPSLRHQRFKEEKTSEDLDKWYARGQRAVRLHICFWKAQGPAATKFRKGACENCGAMTHKTKECMERPRKRGAKWTNSAIAADEVVQAVELGFDAKRDRWNGYDAREHVRLMKEWELVEEERKKIKAQKLDEEMERKRAADAALQAEAAAAGNAEKAVLSEVDTSSDEEMDEDKYADQADMAGQKVDMKSRQTVRNLRIREDIPKYLRNLDPESAYYDPKTRSMRDNPHKDKGPQDVDFAGDNFLRHTGETRKMTETMVFAWQAAERGNDVHVQANPSQAEFLYKEYLKKKDAVRDRQKSGILEKYGGAEHLARPPAELMQQTENYVEYSRTGRVIKGVERAKVRSKYMEDVFPQNHTSVWGSYWVDGQWGYACCHATARNAYCTGEAGKAAAAASAKFATELAGAEPQKSLAEEHAEARAAAGKAGKADKAGDANDELIKKRKHALGEGDVQLSEDKLADALAREKKRQKGKAPALSSKAGLDRDAVDVTEEDLEAHRMLRQRADDPMLNFKDHPDAV